MAIGMAVFVVARGVNFIERVAKILMPALIFLVIVLTIRAVTLPGAGDGLAYLFGIDWSQLGRAELWIAALTQNAWDTGAGWGLGPVLRRVPAACARIPFRTRSFCRPPTISSR